MGYGMGSRDVAPPGDRWLDHKASANQPGDAVLHPRLAIWAVTPASGFFSAAQGPLPISNAKSGLQNSGRRNGMDVGA